MALRKQQYDLLKDTNSELIEFKVFDKDGVQKSNVIKDVLISCPTVLKPINENLAIEYLRPLKEAIKTTNINPLKLLNYNPNFRYSTFNWSFGSLTSPNKVELLQPNTVVPGVIPVSGLFCLHQKFPLTADDKTNHLVKTIPSSTIALSGKDLDLGFSYYIRDAQSVSTVSSRFFISIGADTTGNGTMDLMYDFADNKFSTGTFTDDKFFKLVQTSGYNRWHSYKTKLNDISFNGVNSARLEVKLFPLSTNGILDFNLAETFIDAFYIGQTKGFKKITHTKTNGFNTEIFDSLPVNNLTGEYKVPNTFLTNEIDDFDLSQINGFFGRADRIESTLTNSLDKIILQEILNDYRAPIKKYEGDFYRDDANEIPIYFFNKVWVNFGENILQDNIAAMIDSMEFDVKKNIYRINMHLPNVGTLIDIIFNQDDVLTYDKFKFD
jgi:hypothetical protein